MPETQRVYRDHTNQEYVDVRQPVAPIAMRDLRMAGALAANFGDRAERLRKWALASIADVQLTGADGEAISGPLDADKLDLLPYATHKWIYERLFAAAVEIPLQ